MMEEKPKTNYWIRSGALNLFQNFSSTIMGLIGFAIIARMLSTGNLGVWVLFGTVGTIMELVRSGLIQNAVIKFVAANPGEEGKIVTASLVIGGILTIVCVFAIACFASFLSAILRAPEMETLLYWYIPVFILSGVLTQLCCIEQAHLSYQGVVACNFVRQFIFCLFLVIAFFADYPVKLTHLVFVQIFAVFIASLTSWRYVKKYVTFTFEYSLEWVKKIFHYGKFGFGTSISSLLSGTIDQWMLGTMMNTTSAGLFNVSVRIINLIDIPTNAIATIVFPQSAKRMETSGKEAVKYLYERSVGAILAVLIPGIVFMYLFDDVVLTLLAGEKYRKAVPILNVMLLYAILIPYGRQFGAILDSIGKTKLTFSIVIFTGSVNLLLNFFFIREMGAIGAAIATLISNIIGFAVAQVILFRELNVNAFHPFIYAGHFYTEFYKNHLKKYLVKSKQ